ncbi:hypothetical protein ONS95_005445 [Cadophora gregata]|uniref:uncharacterized protein n=1 Tax=Cadophora gregata TaxID=51156 RepID=UPI0026DAC36A|nr:uncharacterized protein ONS95_005445 [Cadophora gregata]KAK0103421.1 hypothetical protein ONS95_005445 [Cadophora gregata]KAK0107609.1 hypothetical protein ONS96_003415 [Cadophora gregata f. sp. sojae]
MTVYWDFRRILKVDPDKDFTCVGITQPGLRCGNQVGFNYRRQGSRVLNEMDQTKSYSRALENLEDLADLMLCRLQHNSEKKPHLNQVNKVYSKWYAVAKQEYVALKREAERAAERRAAREISLMREAAQLMREDLERGIDDMTAVEVTDSEGRTTPDVSVRELPLDDPFVVPSAESTGMRNSSNSSGVGETTNIEWPVVPTHALSKKIPVFSDQQESTSQQIPCAAEAQVDTTGTAASSIRRDQKSGTTSGFRIAKSDENTSLDLSFVPKGSTATSSRLASGPGPGRRVALKDKSAEINRKMASHTSVLSDSAPTFSFAATIPQSSFSFEVPKQSHLETVSIAAPASEPPRQLAESAEEEAHLESVTSIQDSSALSDESLESPANSRSASFGYAVVTPPSTRYKTYLPARQQHGLMTPPETPETILTAHKSSSPLPPPKIGDYFSSDANQNSPPKISRKPLPTTSRVDIAEGDIEDREPGNVAVGDAESNYERSGCLSRFRFGRLRRKVVGNLRSMKENLAKSAG